MEFKLLLINTMYSNFLFDVYKNNNELQNESYLFQLEYLINNTADVVGSQTKMFRSLGIDTSCIIVNADNLQKTWQKENGIKESNSIKLVYKQVKKFRPDVLFISNVEFISDQWIKQIRENIPQIKLVFGSHCAPYNINTLNEFHSLDFILTCTPGMNEVFRQNGINSYLLYHGFDKALGNRVETAYEEKKMDVSFSGSVFLGGGYHNSRLEYIEAILNAGIKMEVYANIESRYKNLFKQLFYIMNKLSKKLRIENIYKRLSIVNKYSEYLNTPISYYSKNFLNAIKPPVFGDNMYQLIANSKVSFNIHGDVANQYAGNVRLFEITGLGTCLLTDHKENINDLFVVDKEIITYRNIDDCIEKMKWLLINETKRQEIAKAGQMRTLKDHTIENRCKTIINIINKEIEILYFKKYKDINEHTS